MRHHAERSFVLCGELDGTPHRHLLKEGLNRIGSLSSSEVFIEARGVSKRHAILTVEEDQLRLEDLASKNGTLVNGSRIGSAPIRPGDVIRFGSATLRLEETSPAEGRLAIALAQHAAGDRS
ncbi:MAG: FHA domain-containing protein, partial [bacterium]|nr:FHA domain-containing protein [bacterium]